MWIESTEAELVRRAKRGDENAFAALYRTKQGPVYRFSLQMCGSAEVAEEVTQETFVTLAQDLRRYDPSRGALTAYLLGIARNLVLRRLERVRRHENVEEEAGFELTDPCAGPLELLIQNETLEEVRRAVLGLPSSYREAVVLCDLQELSYSEAAAVMDCPIGSVRSRLNRGRALLADKLQAKRVSV